MCLGLRDREFLPPQLKIKYTNKKQSGIYLQYCINNRLQKSYRQHNQAKIITCSSNKGSIIIRRMNRFHNSKLESMETYSVKR